MIISHAKPHDVHAIRTIAESLRFDPTHPKPGALISVLSNDEYLYRINHSDYFYVATNRGNVLGFLIGHQHDLIPELVEQGLFHHDEILPFLAETRTPWAYEESVGVREDLQHTGVGDALMDAWLTEMHDGKIRDAYVMIRHSPARNGPSISFCKKHGFRYQETEVEKNGMVHGVYGRKIYAKP